MSEKELVRRIVWGETRIARLSLILTFTLASLTAHASESPKSLCVALPLFCSAQKAATEPYADVSSVRFVSDVKRPTKAVKPMYPESAKLAGIQGPVVLDIVIGKSGEVEMAQAITGPKELWSAAAEAVKQWRWEPILLNEKAIRVRTKVTVNFVLDESHSPKPKADSH